MKNMTVIDQKNKSILRKLIEVRISHGGDVATPRRLLEDGTPEERELYTKPINMVGYIWAVLVAISAVGAFIFR